MNAQRCPANWLPIEPLRRVILEDIAREVALYDPTDARQNMGYSMLAGRTGLNERSLRRWVNENEYAHIDAADRYCIATGRHLGDVYPELYPPCREIFEHTCRRCGCESMEVTGEGRWRIKLRCLHCGRNTALVRPDDPSIVASRTAPRPHKRMDLREQVAEIVAMYQNGADLGEVAERYHTSIRTIRQVLIEAGVPRRPPCIPRDEQQMLRALAEGLSRWLNERHARWARIARERQAGATTRELAERYGMLAGSIRTACTRDRREPKMRRMCTNPECPRYDRFYETPIPEVVAYDPLLSCCPDCGGEGEDGGLWQKPEQRKGTEAA